MLLTCGVWSVYGSLITCASWTERLYVWEEGGFHLLLYSTCTSPFLSPFLFYAWVRFFFLESIAVYVFVVCMYVSVWCGGAPLSLSLWIVAGMVVAWRHSRAEGEALGRDCNCGYAEEMVGEAIAG